MYRSLTILTKKEDAIECYDNLYQFLPHHKIENTFCVSTSKSDIVNIMSSWAYTLRCNNLDSIYNLRNIAMKAKNEEYDSTLFIDDVVRFLDNIKNMYNDKFSDIIDYMFYDNGAFYFTPTPTLENNISKHIRDYAVITVQISRRDNCEE